LDTWTGVTELLDSSRFSRNDLTLFSGLIILPWMRRPPGIGASCDYTE